jgi:hypothetical protein
MNFARIIDGVAVNVSPAPAEHFHPDLAVLFVDVPDEVGPMWRLEDDVWAPPPAAPVVEPLPALTWENAPAEYWWIDVGPFFDRFGAKALAITSSDDSQIRGLVTLLLPRQYVDLKRPDLPVMLGLLVSKGEITEAEMIAALTTPTTDYERHIKGLPQPAAIEELPSEDA